MDTPGYDVYVEEEQEPEEDSYHEYSLTSYPSDFSLSVLYEQWKAKDIVIPGFQRGYVWDIKQASKLIESFLVGLPIPQIFLYVDEDNKLIVIDGQQRITSIGFFFDGFFGTEHGGRRQIFRLTGLSKLSPFAGKSFEDLDPTTQRKLKGSPLRAINIKQLKPQSDNSSVYHIFERLNTGGTPLKPQEIRNAVYRGPANDLFKKLNEIPQWRYLLGKQSLDKHMRDVELLLRVFSLTYYRQNYDGKMKEFLNKTLEHANKTPNSEQLKHFESAFPYVVDLLAKQLPSNPFSRGGPINSAMLEAVICSCIFNAGILQNLEIQKNFQSLKTDKHFNYAISQTTNSKERVELRYERTTKILLQIV